MSRNLSIIRISNSLFHFVLERSKARKKTGRGEARCAHSPTDFCSTERDRSSVITRTPRFIPHIPSFPVGQCEIHRTLSIIFDLCSRSVVCVTRQLFLLSSRVFVNERVVDDTRIIVVIVASCFVQSFFLYFFFVLHGWKHGMWNYIFFSPSFLFLSLFLFFFL